MAKGGHSRLDAIVGYAEPIPRPGFVFMDTPGYDPVSVTGMVAGGANLIAFTTGRGSVFGSRPVPTVKLATNSELATRMAATSTSTARGGRAGVPWRRWAAGSTTCCWTWPPAATFSEELALGGEEIVPWQLGAVL